MPGGLGRALQVPRGSEAPVAGLEVAEPGTLAQRGGESGETVEAREVGDGGGRVGVGREVATVGDRLGDQEPGGAARGPEGTHADPDLVGEGVVAGPAALGEVHRPAGEGGSYPRQGPMVPPRTQDPEGPARRAVGPGIGDLGPGGVDHGVGAGVHAPADHGEEDRREDGEAPPRRAPRLGPGAVAAPVGEQHRTGGDLEDCQHQAVAVGREDEERRRGQGPDAGDDAEDDESEGQMIVVWRHGPGPSASCPRATIGRTSVGQSTVGQSFDCVLAIWLIN